MNGRELKGAHEAVDRPVNTHHEPDELQGEVFGINDGNQSTQSNHQEPEADVNALLAGLHVKPHLKHVVRDDNEGAA